MQIESWCWKKDTEAVRQRIIMNYTMKSLSKSECFDFINHRIKLANRSEPLFTEDALEILFATSNGWSRILHGFENINYLGD